MTLYPDYKPSGIDWIGDIPSHWDVKKLKYALQSIMGGGTPSTNNPAFWHGTIPWVSPKDMKVPVISQTEDYVTDLAVNNSSTSLIEAGCILVVVRSGILKHTFPVAINSVQVTLNQDMKALQPNERLKSHYLFWMLKGFSDKILTFCNKIGATVDSIETEDLVNFYFPLPPLPEQVAIARYLDTQTAQLDTLIDLLREEKAALINEAVTKGINPGVETKDSGIEWLGDVPAHWEVKKLKWVTRQIIDGAHFTPTYVESGIPFLRVTDIHNKNIRLVVMLSIKYLDKNSTALYILLKLSHAPQGHAHAHGLPKSDTVLAHRYCAQYQCVGLLRRD